MEVEVTSEISPQSAPFIDQKAGEAQSGAWNPGQSWAAFPPPQWVGLSSLGDRGRLPRPGQTAASRLRGSGSGAGVGRINDLRK